MCNVHYFDTWRYAYSHSSFARSKRHLSNYIIRYTAGVSDLRFCRTHFTCCFFSIFSLEFYSPMTHCWLNRCTGELFMTEIRILFAKQNLNIKCLPIDNGYKYTMAMVDLVTNALRYLILIIFPSGNFPPMIQTAFHSSLRGLPTI